MKNMSRLPSLLFLSVLLFSQVSHAITLRLRDGDHLRKLGQLEYIGIEEIPAGWNMNVDTVKGYIFATSGTVPTQCRIASQVLTRTCLPFFPLFIEFNPKYGGTTRAVYSALPELSGKIELFILLANVTRYQLAASAVSTLDFDRAQQEVNVPRPSIYDGTQPVHPEPNTSTHGDICVDGSIGSDSNSGRCPANPVRTITRGIEVFKSVFPDSAARAGKTLLVRGGTYREDMHLVGLEGLPGQPIYVRGYPGERVVLSQWTTHPLDYIARYGALPQDRSQWAIQILGGYYGVNLDRAKWVTLENFAIEGAFVEGVNPDNTEGVTVRFVDVENAGQWGIQAFGDIRDLTIEGCRIYGTSNTWSSEHGIYVAPFPGNGLPLGRRLIVRNNFVALNERFGIQINGGAQDVLVENNIALANKLGGFSVYGVSGVVIRNNIAALNHQQPLVLFTYFDETYFSRTEPENWASRRLRTMGYVTVANNTFVTGPTAPFTGAENPAAMDVLRINESIGRDSTGHYLGEPFFNIEINNNILRGVWRTNIVTSISDSNVDFRGLRMLEGIRFTNNVIYSADGAVKAMLPGQLVGAAHTDITTLEREYPTQWVGNILNQDPRLVDLGNAPGIPAFQYLTPFLNSVTTGVYLLLPNSPARDRGLPIRYSNGTEANLNSDFYGIPRPLGAAPDIGATESF